MIDTIRAILLSVVLDKEVFEKLKQSYQQLNIYIKNYYDDLTGEAWFAVQIRNHIIPYIVYNSRSKILTIEHSIPKYLYGNNLQMIGTTDIDTYFNKLHKDLYDLFEIHIDKNDWIAHRVDVSYNFNTYSTDYLIEEWLYYLSKQNIPYKPIKNIRTDTKHNRVSGVEYTTRSNNAKLNFYDKELEMSQNKYDYDEELLADSEGVLRIEIKTTKYERQSYSSSQKLVDYLTPEFFDHIFSKYKIETILAGKYMETVRNDELDKQMIISNRNNKELKKIVIHLLGYLNLRDITEEYITDFYSDSTIKRRQDDLFTYEQFKQSMKEISPTMDKPIQFIDVEQFR